MSLLDDQRLGAARHFLRDAQARWRRANARLAARIDRTMPKSVHLVWDALCGANARRPSPAPGNSTFSTSAPRSASNVDDQGPAMMVEMSRIRIPASGPLIRL